MKPKLWPSRMPATKSPHVPIYVLSSASCRYKIPSAFGSPEDSKHPKYPGLQMGRGGPRPLLSRTFEDSWGMASTQLTLNASPRLAKLRRFSPNLMSSGSPLHVPAHQKQSPTERHLIGSSKRCPFKDSLRLPTTIESIG